MSDEELIRRGDAREALREVDAWTIPTAHAINSLPAVTVRVKPLVWRDEFMRWSGNSFTSTAVGAGHTYIIAASLDDPEAENVIAAKKAAAQADYEARIRAALEPVAAPVMALLSDAEIASIMAEGPKGPPMLMPDPDAIREEALREAAALCFKNADGITEAVSAFPQIKKRRVLLQRAEQAKVDAAAILALIQKGGDACDKDDDPTNARPETSPGVTAGAIQKGAAK